MIKRWWVAVTLSLVGHGLIVVGVMRLCALLQASQLNPKSPVNRVIEEPVDYGTVSISFAEDVRPPVVESPPRQVKPLPLPPTRRDDQPARVPVKPQNSPAEPPPKQNPQGSGLVQASHHERGVAPLHGMITRPGISIVYVLDQSGSMGRERKLQRAIGMLKASLRQLGPDVRFQVVGYDSRATICRIGGNTELVYAKEGNVAEAESLLDRVVGEGSSRHSEGLIAGLRLHPDILILLTDADELSPAEVARIRQWNRNGTAIHAVLFGAQPSSDSPLEKITGPARLHCVKMP